MKIVNVAPSSALNCNLYHIILILQNAAMEVSSL